MTDETGTSDEPIVIESPYTAEELAEMGWMYGRTGMGRTTLHSSWFTWLTTHGDEVPGLLIDPAGEETDLNDDRSRINPLDVDPNDQEPLDGGDP